MASELRTTNGMCYAYKDVDHLKPPIVFIHGFPMDHRDWDLIGETGRTEIRVDLPGFGGSKLLPGAGDIAEYASKLCELLDAFEIHKAVLCAHSMGGYVALSFLDQYPDLVEGLVLVGSQTLADSEEKKAGRRKMIDAIEREGIEAVMNFAEMLGADGAGKNFFSPIIKEQDPRAARWAIEAMIGRKDLTKLFVEANIPKLIIHGQADQLVPFNKKLFEGAQRLQIKLLDDVGHSPMVEKPDEFTKIMNEWL